MDGIKKIRENSELTQAEMAAKLMVSFSLYQKIECGSRKPTTRFILKFKQAYPGTSADIFFEMGGDKE